MRLKDPLLCFFSVASLLGLLLVTYSNFSEAKVILGAVGNWHTLPKSHFFMLALGIVAAAIATRSLVVEIAEQKQRLKLAEKLTTEAKHRYGEGGVFEKSGRTRKRSAEPARARFLVMLFMPGADGDAFLGDLEEGWRRIVNDKTLGPRYAAFWYWFQVMMSLGALAWVFFRKLTGLAAAIEAIRKVIK
jgi:hypothetical protein